MTRNKKQFMSIVEWIFVTNADTPIGQILSSLIRIETEHFPMWIMSVFFWYIIVNYRTFQLLMNPRLASYYYFNWRKYINSPSVTFLKMTICMTYKRYHVCMVNTSSVQQTLYCWWLHLVIGACIVNKEVHSSY